MIIPNDSTSKNKVSGHVYLLDWLITLDLIFKLYKIDLIFKLYKIAIIDVCGSKNRCEQLWQFRCLCVCPFTLARSSQISNPMPRFTPIFPEYPTTQKMKGEKLQYFHLITCSLTKTGVVVKFWIQNNIVFWLKWSTLEVRYTSCKLFRHNFSTRSHKIMAIEN